MDIENILEEIKNNPLLGGITLSGGEPFEQAAAFSRLAQRVKKLNLDVIVYTGYTYEKLLRAIPKRPDWKSLLDTADILIDGPFIEEQKSYMLKFRGSANQRIIDMRKSRKLDRLVLADI